MITSFDLFTRFFDIISYLFMLWIIFYLIVRAHSFEHEDIEGIKFRSFFKFDVDSSISLCDQWGGLESWVPHSLAPIFLSRFAKNRNFSNILSVRIWWTPKFTFFVRIPVNYFHFSYDCRIGLHTFKPYLIRWRRI